MQTSLRSVCVRSATLEILIPMATSKAPPHAVFGRCWVTALGESQPSAGAHANAPKGVFALSAPFMTSYASLQSGRETADPKIRRCFAVPSLAVMSGLGWAEIVRCL